MTAFAENGDEPTTLVEADLFAQPVAINPIARVGEPLRVEFEESLTGGVQSSQVICPAGAVMVSCSESRK